MLHGLRGALFLLVCFLFEPARSTRFEAEFEARYGIEPRYAIDGCLFYGNYFHDKMCGVYKYTLFEARSGILNKLSKELCPTFKDLDKALRGIPKTKQFLDGLSTSQRRKCREEVACVKRSGTFFGIPLTAECEQGGIKYEERNPTFGSQWETYLANSMLTCTFRYTPMTEMETFFDDIEICARLVSTDAKADTIATELSNIVETVRTNRQTEIIPFNWYRLVQAYNGGQRSNLLELNLLFNLNNDDTNTTLMTFYKPAMQYVNFAELDMISLEAAQTGDPLVMSEDKNYFTGLLLGYKYAADSVFIYSEKNLNMESDMSDAEQVAVLNGKTFKMPQRCIDPYTFTVKQALVVKPWKNMQEYRTWVSIKAQQWAMSKVYACQFEEFIAEATKPVGEDGTSFYETLGYSRYEAEKLQTLHLRWYQFMVGVKTRVHIHRLIYNGKLGMMIGGIALMIGGILFAYWELNTRKAYSNSMWHLSRVSSHKDALSESDRKKGFLFIKDKPINRHVTKIWIATMYECCQQTPPTEDELRGAGSDASLDMVDDIEASRQSTRQSVMISQVTRGQRESAMAKIAPKLAHKRQIRLPSRKGSQSSMLSFLSSHASSDDITP